MPEGAEGTTADVEMPFADVEMPFADVEMSRADVEIPFADVEMPPADARSDRTLADMTRRLSLTTAFFPSKAAEKKDDCDVNDY